MCIYILCIYIYILCVYIYIIYIYIYTEMLFDAGYIDKELFKHTYTINIFTFSIQCWTEKFFFHINEYSL